MELAQKQLALQSAKTREWLKSHFIFSGGLKFAT